MAQFQAYSSDVEVNGQSVRSVAEAMGAFRHFALEILRQHGIDDPRPGMWYPQQAWLDAFETIAERIGPKTLQAIGKKIPDVADLPGKPDSIAEALQMMDIGYHMNHRLRGQVMFDPERGTILDGIGNYVCRGAGEKLIEVCATSPYPCEFDRGVIEGMAELGRPEGVVWIRVDHLDGECRKQGVDRCRYQVRW